MRVAVVGGGLIGLAVAREFLQRRPSAEVLVFEKEDRVAAHQTGRNSGVVHAGLYYEPGGLKARLCRRGSGLLKEFAVDHGVTYQECGKIVVAHDGAERQRLKAIYERATANGVPGVEMIDSTGIQQIEPYAAGVAALHSPQTAIVDYVGVAQALVGEITLGGGHVLLGHEISGIRHLNAAETGAGARVRISAESNEGSVTDDVDLVITCAGLQSDRLARRSEEQAAPRVVPFFGDYFMLSPEKAERVNGLIYPTPDPKYPFLGVHITRRWDGEVMLGPNAFLSLGREAYRRTGVNMRDLSDIVTFPGFWKFAASNVPAVLREVRTAVSRKMFVEEASKCMPGLQPGDVRRGPRGIRAQAMNTDGSLVDDFVITGSGQVVHVRNAPSPGATSALAIAEHIVAETLERASRT